jgi:DNA-directed RNA polymerase subunit M/transcription elongation factor TFIIS
MKPNDFRIGNLINYKVFDELDERKSWYELSEIDHDDLRFFSLKDDEDEDYQMIPLTKEWLYNFGFSVRKESSNFYYFGYGENPRTKDWMLCLKYFEDENRFFFMNGHHTIKYVHQLQNLYFALTGEELKIKTDSKLICPKCKNEENFHENRDYSKKEQPVTEIICNECGTIINKNNNNE